MLMIQICCLIQSRSPSLNRILPRDLESEKSSSFTSIIGSPGGIYQPGWGVTNCCRLDTSDACQDVVDHIVPPGYFSELRHLPNDDFLSQYNINLVRQVGMGSQLRRRVEQEVRRRKRAMEKITKREQRIQAREEKIKRLDTEVKSLKVTGEERIKAAFEEFKKYEDNKVEQRCAKMDARLDKLSVTSRSDKETKSHIM
ncbi:hypothetical protein Tco_0640203, partial [Tanacetum coccineum]